MDRRRHMPTLEEASDVHRQSAGRRRHMPTAEEALKLSRQFAERRGGHTSKHEQDAIALKEAIRSLFENILRSVALKPDTTGISVKISVDYPEGTISQQRHQ